MDRKRKRSCCHDTGHDSPLETSSYNESSETSSRKRHKSSRLAVNAHSARQTSSRPVSPSSCYREYAIGDPAALQYVHRVTYYGQEITEKFPPGSTPEAAHSRRKKREHWQNRVRACETSDSDTETETELKAARKNGCPPLQGGLERFPPLRTSVSTPSATPLVPQRTMTPY